MKKCSENTVYSVKEKKEAQRDENPPRFNQIDSNAVVSRVLQLLHYLAVCGPVCYLQSSPLHETQELLQSSPIPMSEAKVSQKLRHS